MPSSTFTIGASERAALRAQASQSLSGIGDILISFERGDFAAAERLGTRAAQEIRLLSDLGWAPQDDRKTYELTMPADELAAALTRIRSEAEGGVEEPEERRALAEAQATLNRYRRTVEVCTELLVLLGQGLPITGAQRQALCELMAYRLFLVGDRRLARAQLEGAPPEQLAEEFGQDLRLMLDIGWDRDEGGPVVLTMEPRSLERTLRRMRQDAVDALAQTANQGPNETDEERAARFATAERVCDELLAALDQPKEEPP